MVGKDERKEGFGRGGSHLQLRPCQPSAGLSLTRI